VGLGFGVWGLRFGVWGLGFGVLEFGVVYDLLFPTPCVPLRNAREKDTHV